MPLRGQRESMAIDGNVLAYLGQAIAEGYDPATDANMQLAAEKVAALRIALYLGGLTMPPKVEAEAGAATVSQVRQVLQGASISLIGRLKPSKLRWIESRAAELLSYHPHQADCRILAEVESIPDLKHLLTCDQGFKRSLNHRTRIQMMSPSDYWNAACVPLGARPRYRPADGNPLAAQSWWLW